MTIEALIERGRELYARGAYAEALECLDEVCERKPTYADVHHLRGLCLAMAGRGEEALDAFDRATGINTRFAEAYVSLAITLGDLGRTDEASEAFRRGAEAADAITTGRYPPPLASQLANGHSRLGDLYAGSGFLAEAAEQYRRACEICPGYADIRHRFGRTLLELGLVESALREFRCALLANPDYLDARCSLGLALFRNGELRRARLEWERCAAQDPKDRQVQAFLAMLGRFEEGFTGESAETVRADRASAHLRSVA